MFTSQAHPLDLMTRPSRLVVVTHDPRKSENPSGAPISKPESVFVSWSAVAKHQKEMKFLAFGQFLTHGTLHARKKISRS